MKVDIRIVYNGGWPRYHSVSEEFLQRLENYIARRPYLDVVITRLSRS